MSDSKTERTKAHIVALSAEIFNKKGFAGTSITDLTKATKLTSGSIYGNFANKEEVALAAFDYNLTAFRNALQQCVDKCETPKDKLLMYLYAFHSSTQANFPAGGCPMLNTLADADDTCEPLRRKAADGIMLWKQDLIKVIEAGKETGDFSNDVNASKTALHLIALCEFGLLMYSATRNSRETDHIIEMAAEFVKTIETAS